MGWDVVEIGLKHDLPIHKPLEVARIISERMGINVRVYAYNKFVYDEKTNSLSSIDKYNEIELGYANVNESDKHIDMEVSDYHAIQLRERLGRRIHNLKYNDVYAKDCFESMFSPFEYYDLNYKDDGREMFNVRILKENIDLDVYINEWGRWSSFISALRNIKESKNWLMTYRKQLHERAKVFGCNQILITCDQGPTIDIYDSLDMASDELLEYVNSKRYVDYISEREGIDYKKEMGHYNFSALLNKEESINDDMFVGVVFDSVE